MTNEMSSQHRTDIEAEDALHGERFGWLRTQKRRRMLCAVAVVALAVHAFGAFTDISLLSPLIALFGLACFMAAYAGLRIAVRKIVDLPDRYIDERMRIVRGEVYRLSYIGVVSLISIILIQHVVLSLVAKWSPALGLVPLSSEQWFEVMILLILSCTAMPSVIYAWRERDI